MWTNSIYSLRGKTPSISITTYYEIDCLHRYPSGSTINTRGQVGKLEGTPFFVPFCTNYSKKQTNKKQNKNKKQNQTNKNKNKKQKQKTKQNKQKQNKKQKTYNSNIYIIP